MLMVGSRLIGMPVLSLHIGGQTASVKRQLRPGRNSLRGAQCFPHVIRADRKGLPGNDPLIAEDTLMRTAKMGDENRDDPTAWIHSFPSARRASSAFFAAACSASFLLRPLPSPAALPS